MVDRDQLATQLRRMFHGGLLRRIPKRAEDAEVLMALSICSVDPNAFLDEADINIHLSGWLDGISDPVSLDHVTLRRYLVDFGFLRRAADGVVYRVVPERVNEVLTPSAQKVNPRDIFHHLEAERAARRDLHNKRQGSE